MGDGGEERHGETPRPLFARRGGEGVRRGAREREKKAAGGGVREERRAEKQREREARPKANAKGKWKAAEGEEEERKRRRRGEALLVCKQRGGAPVRKRPSRNFATASFSLLRRGCPFPFAEYVAENPRKIHRGLFPSDDTVASRGKEGGRKTAAKIFTVIHAYLFEICGWLTDARD